MAREPAHRRLWRGRRRRQPPRRAVAGQRQRRRLQGHARPAAALRRGPRVQHADRRSQHHRPRVGMATRGLKPVVEIQFFDYIWPAMMQLRNEMAMLRYRTGQSLVVPDGRCACRSAAICAAAARTTASRARASSRTVRASASPTRRTRSTPPGCCGLRSAATTRCMFLEHKHLYRQTYNKGEYPGNDFMIPFGKAQPAPRRQRRAGDHVGRAGAALAGRGAARARSMACTRPCSTCGRSCRTTGRRSPRT